MNSYLNFFYVPALTWYVNLLSNKKRSITYVPRKRGNSLVDSVAALGTVGTLVTEHFALQTEVRKKVSHRVLG